MTAKLESEFSSYKEEFENYKVSLQTTTNGLDEDFAENSLNANYQDNSLEYNTKPSDKTGNILTIIPDLKDEYHDGDKTNGEISVTNGKIVFKSLDTESLNIAKGMGYELDPYKTKEEVDASGNKKIVLESSETNLMLVDSTRNFNSSL